MTSRFVDYNVYIIYHGQVQFYEADESDRVLVFEWTKGRSPPASDDE